MIKTYFLLILFCTTMITRGQKSLEVAATGGWVPSLLEGELLTETGVKIGFNRAVRDHWVRSYSLFYATQNSNRVINSAPSKGTYTQFGFYLERFKLKKELGYKSYGYFIYGTGIRIISLSGTYRTTYAYEKYTDSGYEVVTSLGYGMHQNITPKIGFFVEMRGNLGYLQLNNESTQVGIRGYVASGLRVQLKNNHLKTL